MPREHEYDETGQCKWCPHKDPSKASLAAPPVQPHPVGYHTWSPSEGWKATQLTIGREVLGLYWHVRDGFKPTPRKKAFVDERDAKLWVLRAAINHHKSKLASLEEELVRLND